MKICVTVLNRVFNYFVMSFISDKFRRKIGGYRIIALLCTTLLCCFLIYRWSSLGNMSLVARDREFFLHGEKVRLISGAMHYFRVVPQYWEDRMKRMKACGLNTLETYVPWNWHEEVRGEFNFDGILDIREYIKTAQKVGLHVIVRPGPYICAEWDFGGLPSWLLNDPDMKVREDYKPYIDAVDKYFSKLLPLFTDLQATEGGPIIAFQLENEYGSYNDDANYKNFLKQKFQKEGLVELFFTSDNGIGIQRGEVKETLITANFQEKEHGYLIQKYLNDVKQPTMPFMVMEFWSGWFDHWGEQHHIWPANEYEKVLRWILSHQGSVNFYMFHGGTNFGFMAGANEGLGATNEGNKQPYQADITSYDYDAPVAENGELTDKWYLTKNILQELLPNQVGSNLPKPPAPIPSKAYGEIKVDSYLPLSECLKLIEPIRSSKVMPMEMLDINNGGGQSFGLILYRIMVNPGSKKLKFPGIIRDRAIIYLDGEEKETMDFSKPDHVPAFVFPKDETSKLDILVENMGRVNYAEYRSPVLNNQRKGLFGLQIDNKDVTDVQIFPLEFKTAFIESVSGSSGWRKGTPPNFKPSLVRVLLNIDDTPCDTYINMKKWTKGMVFVNGFNLGRYWNVGPQDTLYIPAPLLKSGENQILIFELHQAAESVKFEDKATLGETVVHTTEITGVDKALVTMLKGLLKLGPWVWKPAQLFMK